MTSCSYHYSKYWCTAFRAAGSCSFKKRKYFGPIVRTRPPPASKQLKEYECFMTRWTFMLRYWDEVRRGVKLLVRSDAAVFWHAIYWVSVVKKVAGPGSLFLCCWGRGPACSYYWTPLRLFGLRHMAWHGVRQIINELGNIQACDRSSWWRSRTHHNVDGTDLVYGQPPFTYCSKKSDPPGRAQQF